MATKKLYTLILAMCPQGHKVEQVCLPEDTDKIVKVMTDLGYNVITTKARILK